MSNQQPFAAQLYSQGFGTAGSYSPVIATTTPGITNTQFKIGQRWVDTASNSEYVLTSFSTVNGVVQANWTVLGIGGSAGGVATLTTDDSTVVVPSAGNINIAGASSQLTTTGSGATVTLHLASSVITPGSLEVTGLLTGDAGATLNSGGTAINIGTDAHTDAINIGTVGARVITIGNVTGAAGLVEHIGTGNYVLNGAATSTYTVGAATTTGTYTLGGTAQTGTITLGSSSGTNIVAIGAGAGATTVNVAGGAAANVVNVAAGNGGTTVGIAAGTGGNTVSINNGANTVANVTNINSGASGANSTVSIMNGAGTAGAQLVNISSGATAVNSTVNVLNGNATAGTLAFNLFGSAAATTAGTVNIGTGAAAHVLNFGSSSAGNITSTIAVGSTYAIVGTGGTINIGIDAANTIAIGNGAFASVVALGSATGGATTTIKAGATGSFSLNGGAATTYAIGAATTTGTIVIGGTAQSTGAITVGNSSATNTLNLGIGNGANTTNISTGTGGNTVHIADGAGVNTVDIANNAGGTSTVVIGSTNSTSTTTIQAGSGTIVMTGAIANSSTITSAGNVLINGAGKYLGIHHGAVTDFCGTCTLASGTVTVLNTNIAAGDIILLTRVSINGSTTLGELTYTISASTNFVVTSVILGTPGSPQTADTSILNYVIIRPI